MLQACSSNAEVAVAPPPEVPTTKVEVTAQFANAHDQSIVAVVHAWVLGDPAGAASCARLVGGDLSPYDGMLEPMGEMATMDPVAKMTREKVPLGKALVYVEASDYLGAPEFAGCVPAEIVQPLTSVVVPLGKARIYDCADAKTEDGAPCDDALICTSGERCKKGKCQGGSPRNCSHLATDGCAAANCVEGTGCVATPLADNTPCNDNLQCTSADVCIGGKCLGTQKDCVTTAPPCRVPIGCDEASGDCLYDNAPVDTDCDDGEFCTIDDKCTSYGACHSSTAYDCSALENQCQTAWCDETADQCATNPEYNGHSCNDNTACTTGDHCDGAGTCVGTPKNCAAYDDQCNKGACVDPSTGQCVKVPVAVGTPCNDFNPQTTSDQCNASGVCVGTIPDAGTPETGPDTGADTGVDTGPADATPG